MPRTFSLQPWGRFMTKKSPACCFHFLSEVLKRKGGKEIVVLVPTWSEWREDKDRLRKFVVGLFFLSFTPLHWLDSLSSSRKAAEADKNEQ